MKHNRKGMLGGMIGSIVLAVVSLILFIGVLVPVTTNLTGNPYYPNATGATTVSFTGTNKTIADNLVTFILLGALLTIIGTVAFARFNE